MDKNEKQRIIQTVAASGFTNIIWSRHAVLRAKKRGIDEAAVMAALTSAEIVEDYPTSPRRAPDCLCLCRVDHEPVHAVIAVLDTDRILIVTVYVPDGEEWTDDYRTRL